jgi:hypothetical protein
MARSVSTPRNAIAVAYAYNAGDLDDWSDSIYNLRGVLQSRYPSLERCDKWLDREDKAVLENGFCYVTVSEYGGLVAVAIVPKDGNLADNWCSKVDLKQAAACFGPLLRSEGRCSNGEQVFSSGGEYLSSNGSRW